MRILIAVVLLAVVAAPAAAADCPPGARCGSITVPLDHTGVTPGTLPLRYAVLPATGTRQGTIVFLTGGPGQSGVPYAPLVAPDLAPVRDTYDIVFMDARGTGESGAVMCEDFVDDYEAACGARLGDRRAFPTTAETARDVDDLRATLGVERVTVLGVSYGTRVAGAYARLFPERTAAVVLDSPVGVGAFDVDSATQIAAMPRVLGETCGTVCGVESAGAALRRAVGRVREHPVRAPVVMGRDMVGHTQMAEEWVLDPLQDSDANPVLRAGLPAALLSLARGDAAPLVHLVDLRHEVLRRADPAPPESAAESALYTDSRFLATMCLEARLPWSPDSSLASRAAAKQRYLSELGPAPFAPFRPALVYRRSVADSCTTWPATPAPAPLPAAGPDVPVLVLSGRADIRTPLEQAQRVADAYPHATLLAVPNVGHGVVGSDPTGCVAAALETFLAGHAPGSCAPPPALAPNRYLPAAPGTMTRARTVALTVEAVRHDLAASALMFAGRQRYELRGLRHGWTMATRGRLSLHEVEWFRGVRVSGTLSANGDGTLTVTGTARRGGDVVLRRFKVVR